jgi:hypothetical protein
MRLASCPRCGKPRPAFDGKTVSCQRCRQVTQLSTATLFLEKANALWPEAEVTLRSKRVLTLIEQHDVWLKDRGWYAIITATLDENWTGENDGHIYDTE